MELAVPGTYDPNQPVIQIQHLQTNMQVITSKQRPRKLSIFGQLCYAVVATLRGGSVAEWLACRRAWVQMAAATQTVHTHRASIQQAAKLVAAVLRVARVTAGLAESNGSLPLGLSLTSPAG